MLGHWEHYAEGKDVGVRGYGDSKAEAFGQAAIAMTAILVDPGHVMPSEKVVIRCSASDDDELLDRWLGAVQDEMRERNMMFSRFEVWLDGAHLSAHAWGASSSSGAPRALTLRHSAPRTLSVARHGDGWIAQAVVRGS
jgi:SHS2 domain-containing protein